MKNVIGLVVSVIFIGAVLVFAKVFEKIGKEVSRKFVHIALGNWWIIAMCFFENWIWASILPFLFIIINYISYKKDLISVMERDKKDGLGTVYYAISLFIIAIVTFGIINKPEIGLCSIFIMAYGDGFAAIIGKKIKSLEYKIGDTKKTLAGSATMFLISFLIIAIYLCMVNSPLWFIKSLVISLVLTIIEAVGIKGTDNIIVPIVSMLLLILATAW